MARIALLDLDGTIYDRGLLVHGAADAVGEIRDAGIPVRFLTNTDSQSHAHVVAKLNDYGIEASRSDLFTPVQACERYLEGARGARVYALANSHVRGDLARHVELVDVEDALERPERVTHVVVGDTRNHLTYRTLDAAFRSVFTGAELLILQPARYMRAHDGEHIDTGAVAAAIRYATGTEGVLLGKPSPEFLRLAAESAGFDPAADELWIVGDDATTDIRMGNEAGETTVLVRTGKYLGQRDLPGIPQAAHEIESIADLPALLASTASGDASAA